MQDRVDELLIQLGMEEAMEHMESNEMPNEEEHAFSHNYQKRKQQIIDSLGTEGKQTWITCHKKKRRWKKSVVILVAAAALFGVSLTVYAAVKMFRIEVEKQARNSTYVYELNRPEDTALPEIRIIPEYIPKGYTLYTEEESISGKMELADGSGDKCIQLISDRNSLSREVPFVSEVKKMQISDTVHADICIRKGLEYRYNALIFFEEDGQLIELMATDKVPYEEVKKVIEGIRYEEIEGSSIPMQKDSESADPAEPVLVVPSENIIQIKQEKNSIRRYMDEAGNEVPITYEVQSCQLLDRLPEDLNKEKLNFRDDQTVSDYFAEDGRAKPFQRIREDWKEGQMIQQEETVNCQLVEMKISMKNIGPTTLRDVFIGCSLEFLEEKEDGMYGWLGVENYPGYTTSGPASYDRMPFYFDQSENTGKEFFYMDLGPGEEKEVRLLYLIEKDVLEHAYVNLEGETDLIGNYLKVE